MNKNNPFGAYVRVSDDKLKTDGQRRQDVKRQIEKIKKFHIAMEWQEPEFFIDDGKSAFKEDYNSRPAFCRMLREIRANRKKRITIEDLERWSRRIEDGLKTMREVSEKCTVTSIAQGQCDQTTPEGWFKTSIAFLLAEWASRSQSSKVKSGMQKRLDDPQAICEVCQKVHLGRVPNICKETLNRKGRSE